jgi:predicted lipoprotein with Yx(FWY)xxD motif
MRSHLRLRRLGVALAVAAIAAALAIPSFAAATKLLHVKTAHNATLNKTILVTTKGRSLYTLSNEGHGKITCKKECLKAWPPLKIAKGAKPTGAKHLSMIKRREGFWQVTYKGRPLYTFSGDAHKGDVNGEGLKDVGTWHAAVVPTTTSTPPATTTTTTTTTPPYSY